MQSVLEMDDGVMVIYRKAKGLMSRCYAVH